MTAARRRQAETVSGMWPRPRPGPMSTYANIQSDQAALSGHCMSANKDSRKWIGLFRKQESHTAVFRFLLVFRAALVSELHRPWNI